MPIYRRHSVAMKSVQPNIRCQNRRGMSLKYSPFHIISHRLDLRLRGVSDVMWVLDKTLEEKSIRDLNFGLRHSGEICSPQTLQRNPSLQFLDLISKRLNFSCRSAGVVLCESFVSVSQLPIWKQILLQFLSLQVHSHPPYILSHSDAIHTYLYMSLFYNIVIDFLSEGLLIKKKKNSRKGRHKKHFQWKILSYCLLDSFTNHSILLCFLLLVP